MPTARLPTSLGERSQINKFEQVQWGGHGNGGLQVNKFEQVWRGRVPEGGGRGWCPHVLWRKGIWGEGQLVNKFKQVWKIRARTGQRVGYGQVNKLSYGDFPLDRQTDMTENITFSQTYVCGRKQIRSSKATLR